MELSVIGLLSGAPSASSTREGELSDDMQGAGSESPYSFEQWLTDIGVTDGAAVVPDVGGELVPNLVLAQGGQGVLSPDEILNRLTGIDGVDAAALSSLSLSREQSAKLADMMRKFLQRPDVNATLGESQRAMLQQVMGQLQQASAEGQPVAAVLKPLLQTQGVAASDVKERGPIVGQMMKWLKQVLRDGPPVKAAPVQPITAVEDDALAKGVALPGFPDGGADTASQEETAQEDETLTAVPVIAATAVLVEDDAVTVEAAPAATSWEALADELLAEAALQDTAMIADAEDMPKATKDIPSADFARILKASDVRDTAMDALDSAAPQLTLKAAAALTQATPSSERVLGGSATGEMKILGMRSQQEKTLAQTETSQAIQPVAEIQANTVDSTFIDGTQPDMFMGGAPVGSSLLTGLSPSSPSAPLSSGILHYANARVPVPEQVQVAVKQAAKEGMDRILIQLQPEELGRIDVRLDMHVDGRAHIVFTVDKADTFEQLQRDARFLEKALQDAGVQTDAGSMEFNLRQQSQPEMGGFGDGQQHAHSGGHDAFSDEVNASLSAGTGEQANDDDTTDILTQTYVLNTDQALDIRV